MEYDSNETPATEWTVTIENAEESSTKVKKGGPFPPKSYTKKD